MKPFDKAEYLDRIARTKTRMAADGVEVLLVTNPTNMNYLSGYDGWSFYVHQLLVLAAELNEPIWVGRAMDANGAKVTVFMGPDNIVGYPDDYVQSTTRHPMDFVADLLKEKGLERRTIGVEMDSYYYSAACHEALRRHLPNTKFEDITTLVSWVRIIKSPREIEYMGEAGRIMENVMATAIDRIAPGLRQCDVVADIYHAQISGTPEFGGDYTAIVPMLPTGVGSSAPHLTWSDDRFRSGETTILELAAARHHYHCPMARTVFLGDVPAPVANGAAILVEALDAALEAIKPGIAAEEVDAAWRTVFARSGIVKESRIGYSVGLGYPPDWGEHTLSLRPGDKTVLEADMTLHCIPGFWLDNWGVEISECIHVTEAGARPFTNLARELVVKN